MCNACLVYVNCNFKYIFVNGFVRAHAMWNVRMRLHACACVCPRALYDLRVYACVCVCELGAESVIPPLRLRVIYR